MIKHTPAPLHVGGMTFDTTVSGFATVRTADGQVTAYVADRYDAELYAASPELLDALIEVRQILFDGMTADYDEMTVALKRSGDAIKKAGGKL